MIRSIPAFQKNPVNTFRISDLHPLAEVGTGVALIFRTDLNRQQSRTQEESAIVWNKPQQESDANPTPQQPSSPPASPPPARPDRQAVLGPSITIKGSLAGEEDLLIEGHVEGEITFKNHAVTVGKRGRVDADLYCKSIYVEGEVHGNLYGEDLVVVRKSANVKGNAVAPRVSLEDGSQFHGAIDMQPKPTQQAAPSKQAGPSKPTPATPKREEQAEPQKTNLEAAAEK